MGEHQQNEEVPLKESVKTVFGGVPPWLRRSRRKEKEGQSTPFEPQQAQAQKENVDLNMQWTSEVGEKGKQDEFASSINKPQPTVLVESFQAETLHESHSNHSAQCGNYNITVL